MDFSALLTRRHNNENSIYGENKAWFVYDIDSGFIDMNYHFENGDKVRIKLREIWGKNDEILK
jgi:hypothetical protein